MDVKDQKIAQLEEQIELLKHVNEELRTAVGRNTGFDGLPRMTRIEATILALLARHGVRTHQQIYAALYAGRLDPPDDDITKVHVHKLRARLEGTGIEIITRLGNGYELEATSREMVLMAMRAYDVRQQREHVA